MKPVELKRRELISVIQKIRNKKKPSTYDIRTLKDAEYELEKLTKRK